MAEALADERIGRQTDVALSDELDTRQLMDVVFTVGFPLARQGRS